MLINPPDPDFESIDGDSKSLKTSFDVKIPYWLRQIQFRIPAGFVSDGASVPRLLRWVYDRQSLGSIAPLTHDFLCEYEGVFINLQGEVIQLPWYAVHTIFLVCMLIDGVSCPKLFNCFVAVMLGGPRWRQYSPERLDSACRRIAALYPELLIFLTPTSSKS